MLFQVNHHLTYQEISELQRTVSIQHFILHGGGRGRDRMLVGFATACEISAYHH